MDFRGSWNNMGGVENGRGWDVNYVNIILKKKILQLFQKTYPF